MSPRQHIGLVIASGAIANLANAVGHVAVIWAVVTLSDNAAAVGQLAFVALGVLVVSSIFGEWAVDRFGARRIAVSGCSFGAVPIAGLAFASSNGILTLPFIFLLVALAQLPDGATTAAFEARLPDLADAAGYRLESVNAVDDVIDGVAMIAGAPLAGVLIASFDISFALWIACTLGLSAALMAALALPPRTEAKVVPDVFGGLVFIWSHRTLFVLLLIAAVLIAAFQAFEDVVLPVLVETAGLGADSLGMVMGAAGLGALVGSIAYVFLSQGRIARQLLPVSLLLISASLAAIATHSDWYVLIGAALTAGVGAGIASPLINTIIQRAAPLQIRGRVLGAATAAAMGLAPFTALVSGYAIDLIGTSGVLSVFACGVATLLLYSRLPSREP